jgi:hypothetical protein
LQIGGAFGLAVVTAVVASNTGTGTDATSIINGFRPGILVAASIALLGLVVALTGLRPRPAMAYDVFPVGDRSPELANAQN